MTDIQYWDDTLTDEIETIRTLIASVSRMSVDMERYAALDRAEKKIRSANGTKRSFKMECRLVGDPNQRSRYERQLAKHDESLLSLSTDLRALRSSAQRGELFVGASGNGTLEESNPEQNGDTMLNEASRLQDKTQTSLDNTRQMVAASKQVGMATVEELHKQRQQIENIDNEALRIEDNLQRADKLIKTFGKRMATDKFIQCFACVNVMLLVGVVLYVILKGGSLTSDKSQGEPDSPVRLLQGFLRGTVLMSESGEDDRSA